jgi:uncharacterized protein
VIVRPVAMADLDEILRHNNDAVPAVNRLVRADLEWFADAARSFLVADVPDAPDAPDAPGVSGDRIAGFLIGLHGPGVPYASPNYAWFAERYDSFVYVDRIVVAAAGRGGGVGSGLYDAFAARGRCDGAEVMLAEVNLRPRNDASLRFHERHGFVPVGVQDTENGAKQVTMLEKRLVGPAASS